MAKLFLKILEGIDKSGKDYYIDSCLSHEPYLYDGIDSPGKKIKQMKLFKKPSNDFVINPKRYKEYLKSCYNSIISQLNEIRDRYKDFDDPIFIYVSRFHISEYVFSKFFGRECVIPNIDSVENELKGICNDVEIIHLYCSYQTYKKRVEICNNDIKVYSKEEFEKLNEEYFKILLTSKVRVIHQCTDGYI